MRGRGALVTREGGIVTMPELVVGSTVVPYEIRRSARARRRRIVVTPDRVEVVAPEGQSDEEIAAYLHRRRRWIFDSLEALRERAAARTGEADRARPGRFVSGAKVLYRGRRMRLRVVTAARDGAGDRASTAPVDGAGDRASTVPVDGAGDRADAAPVDGAGGAPAAADGVRVEYRGGFVVTVPAGLEGECRDARVGAALERWFRERVREDAEYFVRRYAPRLGVEPAGVRIKEQKHLWGSCGRDGVIHLNWQLVFAPRPVLEYAVVHELCHLRDRSHEASFWRLVQEVMPDYEARKGWLERHELSCRWR